MAPNGVGVNTRVGVALASVA